jgi:hypothetical protein
MFVIPTQVGFTHRVVAMLVACAVVLWSVGVYTTAQAANLIEVKDTLTDSGPSVTSGHTFSFEIPAGSFATSTTDYTITFPTTPAPFGGVGTILASDLTVRLNAGAPIAIGNFSTTTTSFSFDNVAATSSDVITVQLASGKVTNPATISSYEMVISIANATGDRGRTRVAIVDYVTVSAIVNTTFDFVVSGTATSTSVNATTTTGASTATTIPFGVLAAGNVYTIAQGLSVSTNAANGFVVTVQQDADLLSSTGADIDSFQNGNYLNSPTSWSAPTNSLLNENTWGHWGLTSDDSDIETASPAEFTTGGGDKWVAASTTPRIIYAHDDPVNGIGQGFGTTTVGYRVQITPLQEAADDYNTTLMYIATPTF